MARARRRVERSGAGKVGTVFEERAWRPGKPGKVAPAASWVAVRVRRVPVTLGPVSAPAFELAAIFFGVTQDAVEITLDQDAKWHRFKLSGDGRSLSIAIKQRETPIAFGGLTARLRQLVTGR